MSTVGHLLVNYPIRTWEAPVGNLSSVHISYNGEISLNQRQWVKSNVVQNAYSRPTRVLWIVLLLLLPLLSILSNPFTSRRHHNHRHIYHPHDYPEFCKMRGSGKRESWVGIRGESGWVGAAIITMNMIITSSP